MAGSNLGWFRIPDLVPLLVSCIADLAPLTAGIQVDLFFATIQRAGNKGSLRVTKPTGNMESYRQSRYMSYFY